jgi:hypothetical protein
VSAVAILGANRGDFALPRDNCSGRTLAPGASCRFVMEFEPSAAGLRKAIAVVRSNDPDEPQVQVALRGTGTQ